MMSSECGRLMLRAACTASQAPARDASCVASVMRSAPSAMCPLESSFFVPVMRSSMDIELEAPAHVRGRGAEGREEEREALLELGPRHDLVEEAALEKELGLAKADRQLLADGPARHALAGETDERAGFGQVHVAERGVGGKHSAGRWVGDDAHVGETRVVETRERG